MRLFRVRISEPRASRWEAVAKLGLLAVGEGAAVRLVRVVVEEQPDLTASFAIIKTPSVLLFKEGAVVARLEGVSEVLEQLDAQLGRTLG